MTLTFTDVLIAVALFTCVPIQYVLVQNWGNAEANRSYALNKSVFLLSYKSVFVFNPKVKDLYINKLHFLFRFVNKLVNFRDKYLNLDSWKRCLVNLLNLEHLFPMVSSEVDPDEGESLAIEVMRYKHKHGYFSCMHCHYLLFYFSVKVNRSLSTTVYPTKLFC